MQETKNMLQKKIVKSLKKVCRKFIDSLKSVVFLDCIIQKNKYKILIMGKSFKDISKSRKCLFLLEVIKITTKRTITNPLKFLEKTRENTKK